MPPDSTIPLLRAGETAGPFTIEIPREFVFYLEFRRRTTRWERLRLKLHLMRKAERLAIWERFRPLLEQLGGLDA